MRLRAQHRRGFGELVLAVRVEHFVTADLLGAIIAYLAWTDHDDPEPLPAPYGTDGYPARVDRALARVDALTKLRIETELREHLMSAGDGENGYAALTEFVRMDDDVLAAGESRAKRLLAGEEGANDG